MNNMQDIDIEKIVKTVSSFKVSFYILKKLSQTRKPYGFMQSSLKVCVTGRERLIRSHSSARFSFELSGNSN